VRVLFHRTVPVATVRMLGAEEVHVWFTGRFVRGVVPGSDVKALSTTWVCVRRSAGVIAAERGWVAGCAVRRRECSAADGAVEVMSHFVFERRKRFLLYNCSLCVNK
jgi:hypothetical protein